MVGEAAALPHRLSKSILRRWIRMRHHKLMKTITSGVDQTPGEAATMMVVTIGPKCAAVSCFRGGEVIVMRRKDRTPKKKNYPRCFILAGTARQSTLKLPPPQPEPSGLSSEAHDERIQQVMITVPRGLVGMTSTTIEEVKPGKCRSWGGRRR